MKIHVPSMLHVYSLAEESKKEKKRKETRPAKVHVHVCRKWVNEVGFFLSFLKIPVWLACYAHGVHVHLAPLDMFFSCISYTYMYMLGVLACSAMEQLPSNLVCQYFHPPNMWPCGTAIM